jgi:hypothetical protein
LSALQQLQHLQLEGLNMTVNPVQQIMQNVETAGLDPVAAAMARYRAVLSSRLKNAQQVSVGLGAALPHLLQLTYLSINEYGLESVVLQGISKLQQLRELRLQDCQQSAKLCKAVHKTLAHLPASLTAVAFAACDCSERAGPPVVLDSSSAGRLQQLSRLQQLKLKGVVLRDAPGVLGSLSQLTHLNLGCDW